MGQVGKDIYKIYRFFCFLFLYRATLLRCNPEKDKKNKRVRTMRTWYSRQSRHVANIVSACHCCTYDLLITQGLYSTWKRRYHETLETFGHVLALGTVPRFTNFCTAPHPKIQLNFVKHFRMFTVSFSNFHSCFAIIVQISQI